VIKGSESLLIDQGVGVVVRIDQGVGVVVRADGRFAVRLRLDETLPRKRRTAQRTRRVQP
jgi:hypothetical protein